MPRRTVLPVLAVACHRLFAAAAFVFLLPALFALFAGAARQGLPTVLGFFPAAAHLFVFTAGQSLCRLGVFASVLILTAAAARWFTYGFA
jgi:hypothetical protein